MCNVPRSTAVRAQTRLPRALAGLGIYAAADIAPCAYEGSLIDSAKIRADGRDHSAKLEEVYEKAKTMLDNL